MKQTSNNRAADQDAIQIVAAVSVNEKAKQNKMHRQYLIIPLAAAWAMSTHSAECALNGPLNLWNMGCFLSRATQSERVQISHARCMRCMCPHMIRREGS